MPRQEAPPAVSPAASVFGGGRFRRSRSAACRLGKGDTRRSPPGSAPLPSGRGDRGVAVRTQTSQGVGAHTFRKRCPPTPGLTTGQLLLSEGRERSHSSSSSSTMASPPGGRGDFFVFPDTAQTILSPDKFFQLSDAVSSVPSLSGPTCL